MVAGPSEVHSPAPKIKMGSQSPVRITAPNAATPTKVNAANDLCSLSPAPVVMTSATPVKILAEGGPVVSLPRPTGRSWTQSTSEESVDSGPVAVKDTTKPAAKQAIEQKKQPRKVSYKIPRYTGNRRNQSRSEPSDSSIKP